MYLHLAHTHLSSCMWRGFQHLPGLPSFSHRPCFGKNLNSSLILSATLLFLPQSDSRSSSCYRHALNQSLLSIRSHISSLERNSTNLSSSSLPPYSPRFGTSVWAILTSYPSLSHLPTLGMTHLDNLFKVHFLAVFVLLIQLKLIN